VQRLIHYSISLFVIIFSINAAALDVGVGVKAGTTGVGVDISFALTRTINARLSLTSYDFDSRSETVEIDDADNRATIDADLAIDFGANALLFDWYVFDGTFHLTTGIVQNNTEFDLTGQLSDATVVFDGTTYNVLNDFSDPTMSGTVKLSDSFEPYMGVGWGRKAGAYSGFSLSFELGIMFISPEINLKAPTHVDPNLQAQLDEDVKEAEDAALDEISDFEIWPVVSLGLNYAF